MQILVDASFPGANTLWIIQGGLKYFTLYNKFVAVTQSYVAFKVSNLNTAISFK